MGADKLAVSPLCAALAGRRYARTRDSRVRRHVSVGLVALRRVCLGLCHLSANGTSDEVQRRRGWDGAESDWEGLELACDTVTRIDMTSYELYVSGAGPLAAV